MSSKSKSTAQPAHPSTEEPDLAHACNDGWVTLGQIVVDSSPVSESEEYALCLCRKCAERS
jgi:hypothetical protein